MDTSDVDDFLRDLGVSAASPSKSKNENNDDDEDQPAGADLLSEDIDEAATSFLSELGLEPTSPSAAAVQKDDGAVLESDLISEREQEVEQESSSMFGEGLENLEVVETSLAGAALELVSEALSLPVQVVTGDVLPGERENHVWFEKDESAEATDQSLTPLTNTESPIRPRVAPPTSTLVLDTGDEEDDFDFTPSVSSVNPVKAGSHTLGPRFHSAPASTVKSATSASSLGGQVSDPPSQGAIPSKASSPTRANAAAISVPASSESSFDVNRWAKWSKALELSDASLVASARSAQKSSVHIPPVVASVAPTTAHAIQLMTALQSLIGSDFLKGRGFLGADARAKVSPRTAVLLFALAKYHDPVLAALPELEELCASPELFGLYDGQHGDEIALSLWDSLLLGEDASDGFESPQKGSIFFALGLLMTTTAEGATDSVPRDESGISSMVRRARRDYGLTQRAMAKASRAASSTPNSFLVLTGEPELDFTQLIQLPVYLRSSSSASSQNSGSAALPSFGSNNDESAGLQSGQAKKAGNSAWSNTISGLRQFATKASAQLQEKLAEPIDQGLPGSYVSPFADRRFLLRDTSALFHDPTITRDAQGRLVSPAFPAHCSLHSVGGVNCTAMSGSVATRQIEIARRHDELLSASPAQSRAILPEDALWDGVHPKSSCIVLLSKLPQPASSAGMINTGAVLSTIGLHHQAQPGTPGSARHDPLATPRFNPARVMEARRVLLQPIQTFFKRFSPSRVDQVGELINVYIGREIGLLNQLRRVYGSCVPGDPELDGRTLGLLTMSSEDFGDALCVEKNIWDEDIFVDIRDRRIQLETGCFPSCLTSVDGLVERLTQVLTPGSPDRSVYLLGSGSWRFAGVAGDAVREEHARLQEVSEVAEACSIIRGAVAAIVEKLVDKQRIPTVKLALVHGGFSECLRHVVAAGLDPGLIDVAPLESTSTSQKADDGYVEGVYSRGCAAFARLNLEDPDSVSAFVEGYYDDFAPPQPAEDAEMGPGDRPRTASLDASSHEPEGASAQHGYAPIDSSANLPSGGIDFEAAVVAPSSTGLQPMMAHAQPTIAATLAAASAFNAKAAVSLGRFAALTSAAAQRASKSMSSKLQGPISGSPTSSPNSKPASERNNEEGNPRDLTLDVGVGEEHEI